MAYRFKRRESIPEGVRRVAGEEIDAAVADLAPTAPDLHEGVHEARKRFKKIRAVLRLARSELGDEVYRRENVWYRDAGRRLSEARDAEAMIETFDKLRERYPGPFERRSFRAVRKELVRRRDALTEHADEFGRTVAEVRAELASARERIAEWNLDDPGFDAIAPGLRRIYRAGRRALARASEEASPENFHELRKRVKDLWYHVRLLRGVWPECMGALETELKALSDHLGDDHDLVVFEGHLGELEGSKFDRSDVDAMLEFARQRQEELRAAAMDLARRVHGEKPARFRDRMEAYWTAWKS
jgi:CHAD domain-containing protein